MTKKASPATTKSPPSRRQFSEEFRRDAFQMLLDGHSAVTVASALDLRAQELEAELLRVTRERDILPLNTSISFCHFRQDFSIF